jgi:hypothetical protein
MKTIFEYHGDRNDLTFLSLGAVKKDSANSGIRLINDLWLANGFTKEFDTAIDNTDSLVFKLIGIKSVLQVDMQNYYYG